MKIATFDVNGIRARVANLLEWLEREKPDVCLQELKASDDAFPVMALSAVGYGAIWNGQKSWNGVAILARGTNPVETRRKLPGDDEDSHSRYLEATFKPSWEILRSSNSSSLRFTQSGTSMRGS